MIARSGEWKVLTLSFTSHQVVLGKVQAVRCGKDGHQLQLCALVVQDRHLATATAQHCTGLGSMFQQAIDQVHTHALSSTGVVAGRTGTTECTHHWHTPQR